VSIVAEGDRLVSHEEVVELADAVSILGGIASGIGTTRYGAQLLIEADDRESAQRRGEAEFTLAAQRAGLPAWPVSTVDVLSEADELDQQHELDL
jgi:hypothetical protein